MNRSLWYLFFLIICAVFVKKNSAEATLDLICKHERSSHYNQVLQSNNDDALQVQSENHFIGRLDIENNISIKKHFPVFLAVDSLLREIYFSSLISSNRKKQNNFSIFFSASQIIFPFHNFW